MHHYYYQGLKSASPRASRHLITPCITCYITLNTPCITICCITPLPLSLCTLYSLYYTLHHSLHHYLHHLLHHLLHHSLHHYLPHFLHHLLHHSLHHYLHHILHHLLHHSLHHYLHHFLHHLLHQSLHHYLHHFLHHLLHHSLHHNLHHLLHKNVYHFFFISIVPLSIPSCIIPCIASINNGPWDPKQNSSLTSLRSTSFALLSDSFSIMLLMRCLSASNIIGLKYFWPQILSCPLKICDVATTRNYVMLKYLFSQEHNILVIL